MKTFTSIFFISLLFGSTLYGQHEYGILTMRLSTNVNSKIIATQDTVSDFISLLDSLALNSDNSFFKQHCGSIINVLQSRNLSAYEISFIKKMFTAFSDTNVTWNAANLSSYLERKRPFIISWTSLADSIVSPAWLLLPQNWDPEKSYPLYVTLHGLYTPYTNPIEYMARYLTPDLVVEKSFEDGYSLFPWGRGNIWYEGIGETDVWESISAAQNLVKVDSTKKYLVGHSMGGYGVWAIGQKSAKTWAALGIYAGALGYNNNKYLTATVAQNLKDVPVYFVCGTQDGLIGVNQTAFQLLQDAGNTNLAFVTFQGGHESLLENWQNMYEWVKNFTNEGHGNGINAPDVQIPLRTALYPNYPNPFNPTTTINFSNANLQFANLKIYDLLGHEIAVLVNEEKSVGTYTVTWDASNMASGIYFYKLTTPNFTDIKKMVVLK